MPERPSVSVAESSQEAQVVGPAPISARAPEGALRRRALMSRDDSDALPRVFGRYVLFDRIINDIFNASVANW